MLERHVPEMDNYSLPNSDTLLLAVFVAVVVHVLILLGVNFSSPQPHKISKSLEITLANAPVKNVVKQAKYLATENQFAAGEHAKKPEPLAEKSLPSSRPVVPPAKKPEPVTIAESKKPVMQKLLTRPESPLKVAKPTVAPEQPVEVAETKPVLSVETLQQQIAEYTSAASIRASQQSSENSKIKFANSISAHKYLAAQYVRDWTDKIERIGAMNLPEYEQYARNKDKAQLSMDVGINPDGSIYSMRIVKSSGNTALDEAAKHIVKMSAPFAPLPDDLLREVNVLVITRVWEFRAGMTAR